MGPPAVKARGRGWYVWKIAAYTCAAAITVFLPFTLWAWDIGEVLYILFVAITACLALLIAVFLCVFKKSRHSGIALLSVTIVYCSVTSVLVLKAYNLRIAERWLLWSKSYKARVLAEPNPGQGAMRHLEWDGWGFAGSDTYVYLIFDPDDRLSSFANSSFHGKINDEICGVSRVYRLEPCWYSVVFDTDMKWAACE